MDLKYSAKFMAKIGIFVAISFVVSLFEFPIFPSAPFLKLDFSTVFVLIGGYALGPLQGIVILLLKCLLCVLKNGDYVGQLSNFIVGFSYIIVPTTFYKYKKGLSSVIAFLIVGCILHIIFGLLSNLFIGFPLYYGKNYLSVFFSLVWVLAAFNLIKSVSVSLITILLYKRVKKLISLI